MILGRVVEESGVHVPLQSRRSRLGSCCAHRMKHQDCASPRKVNASSPMSIGTLAKHAC